MTQEFGAELVKKVAEAIASQIEDSPEDWISEAKAVLSVIAPHYEKQIAACVML